MTDLKPCPFCGDEPVAQAGDDGTFRIKCFTPGCFLYEVQVGEWWPSESEAVAAWNTRAATDPRDFNYAVHDGELWEKRKTCRNVSPAKHGYMDFDFVCNECGYEEDIDPRFCPSCGAKVVG